MAALDSAVEGFLMSGLRVVVAVGSTLAETQAFAPGVKPGVQVGGPGVAVGPVTFIT